MVVNLLGNLIEPDKIYMVTDLLKPKTRKFNDSETSSDDERDWMDRFTIHFMNDKSMTITAYDSSNNRLTL